MPGVRGPARPKVSPAREGPAGRRRPRGRPGPAERVPAGGITSRAHKHVHATAFRGSTVGAGVGASTSPMLWMRYAAWTGCSVGALGGSAPVLKAARDFVDVLTGEGTAHVDPPGHCDKRTCSRNSLDVAPA